MKSSYGLAVRSSEASKSSPSVQQDHEQPTGLVHSGQRVTQSRPFGDGHGSNALPFDAVGKNAFAL